VSSLLLVEDDDRISHPLLRLLENEGFEVHHVDRGSLAISAAASLRPDLVLLDLGLPDMDGLDVCRELRAAHPEIAIVVLTARSEEVDVVVGLGAGADDYVAKPFRVGELVARINARLRHTRVHGAPVAGDTEQGRPHPARLVIDLAGRRVWDDGVELVLAPKEFDLLAYLAGKPGVVLRREQIMSDVWDENWWGSTRTLDTHIASLRRKLVDVAEPPTRISTIRGVGFRFEG
jgi:DNA-binding response OmpR family regulator